MELDWGKLALGGAGMLLGAISGAWIWAQRAAAIASAAAQKAGEDALIETARTAGTASLAASLQGAFVGGLIGLVAVGAYLYFSDPDREFKIKKMDTGDDRY